MTGCSHDQPARPVPAAADRSADLERILGAEHPDTLTTRHNLASAHQDTGRVTEAIAIYEPLLAQRERILGAEHPDTMATHHNLAGAYRAIGRVQEAAAVQEDPGRGDAR